MSKISLMHLNHNLLCSLATFQTGPVAEMHDILEIALVPVDAQLKPLRGLQTNSQMIVPICLTMIPLRPENIGIDSYEHYKVTNKKLAEAVNHGMDRNNGILVLEKWFEDLKLPLHKKIVPLCYDWPQKRAFLIEWLGWETFKYFFHPFEFRDLLASALYMNDKMDLRAEQIPYPDSHEYYLHLYTKSEWLGRNAFSNAHTLIEVYKRILMDQYTFSDIQLANSEPTNADPQLLDPLEDD